MLFNIRPLPARKKYTMLETINIRLGLIRSGLPGSASNVVLIFNNCRGVLHEYKVDYISILLDNHHRRDVDWYGKWQCVRCDFDVLVGTRGFC
jgi:hypothetical protein